MLDTPLHELIGPARRTAEVLIAKCGRLRDEPGDKPTLKILLHGPPGTGKTAAAELAARALVDHVTAIDSRNGRQMTIETVRELSLDLRSSFMWSTWRALVINEVDLLNAAAQEVMLSVLDDLLPYRAVICTSNQNRLMLQERFRSRFQHFEVDRPSDEEIAGIVRERLGVSRAIADMIAMGAGGNVRMALNDAATYADLRSA